MPKAKPSKLKTETPDPKAFDRFKEFTKRILTVRKDEIAEDKDDSHSGKPRQ